VKKSQRFANIDPAAPCELVRKYLEKTTRIQGSDRILCAAIDIFLSGMKVIVELLTGRGKILGDFSLYNRLI